MPEKIYTDPKTKQVYKQNREDGSRPVQEIVDIVKMLKSEGIPITRQEFKTDYEFKIADSLK